MARFKELCVVVLDVGLTDGALPFAEQAIQLLVHSKLVDKTTHELALVLFGTTDTRNACNSECVTAGSDGQYLHITTAHTLGLPSIEYLQTIHNITPGTGNADILDGLAVAVDLIRAKEKQEPLSKDYPKRIILISSFLSNPRKGEDNSAFIAGLGEAITALKTCRLEIVDVKPSPSTPLDSTAKAARAENLEAIAELCSQNDFLSTEHEVDHPIDLLAVFPAKEFAPASANYSMNLEIGESCKISVKIATKTAQQKCPSLGKTSSDDAAKEPPKKETVYFKVSDVDKSTPYTVEDTVKAYRYGKESIPFTKADEEAAKYEPENGLSVLGFVDASEIPRYYYMSTATVMVADKGTPAAHTALSALVIALHRKEKVAIVRGVMRKSVKILLGTPVLSTGAAPEHFVMNELPFQEDLRNFTFPGLVREGRKASQEQLDAAQDLVASMQLSDHLKVEEQGNPVLRRFIRFFCEKALNPDSGVPEDDPYLRRVTEPRLEEMPQAEAAAAAAAELFTTGPSNSRGPGRALRRLRADHETEDFITMMQQDNYTEAISAMRKHIEALVDQSVGDQRYAIAVERLQLLRAECLSRRLASSFNHQLRHLGDKYANNPVKGVFWRMVGAAGVTLVSDEEVPDGGGVTEEEADKFLAAAKGE